jgi:Tfp pilus assembly protein PilZ
MSAEQRRYERIPLELPCRLYIEDEAGELRFEAFCTTGNLCLGGVFVVADFLMKSGVDVIAELDLPDGPLPVPGRVAHSVAHDDPREETGMGIQFHDVDAAARETLLRYFAPARYHAFYDAVTDEFAAVEGELDLSQVSLIINLWEEWKVTQTGGPLGTESGAPEATPKRKR